MRPSVLLAALFAVPARAQDCPCPPTPPPPPNWSVSFGGGLALTGGNTDTSSYNLAANAAYDPHKKNVLRAEALYLHASEKDQATVDRTLASARDEYALGPRAFVYGQLAYQHDKFKQVDYLIAPAAGLGIRLAKAPKLAANLDGGLGAAFEKLQGQDASSNLALNGGERVEWKPNATTTLFERASGLWKTEDFSDAYYHFEVGLATSLAKRLEAKLSFSDDYKTRPALPNLKKSDTSFIVSLLYKL
jgi:putative salt-induced outer membrane protein YdiY